MKLCLVLALLLALSGCGVGSSSDARATNPDRPQTQIGDFRTVAGTRFLIASLHTEYSRSYSSDPYYGGAAVNHLFYNLDTQTAEWLFPGMGQRVLETRALTPTPNSDTGDSSLSPQEDPQEDEEVRAFLYRVVTRDTDGDGKLDSDDVSTLAASAPSGTGYVVLVESVDRFLGAFWIDGEHVLLVYETDGRVQGVEFGVEQREVTRRVRLPSAPGTAPPV